MKLRTCLLFATTAIASASGAMAQSAPASQPQASTPDSPVDSAGDIIVTATRRAESLQNVPMSVNVATGTQIQSLNLFDTKDISQLAPGLELTNLSGRNNTTTLRGITFDPDSGTSPAVQLYLNELPIDAQTAFTALYDIGQIEVLRGPQGSLRGLSSPAGAITIRTQRPAFDTISGYAQATGTDHSAYNFQAGVTLPFSDKLALRTAFLVDGNDLNQVHDVNRDDHSRSRTESGRLTLGWKPVDNFTAYLTYQYLEADNRQYAQVIGDGNAPAALFGDPTRNGPPAGKNDYISVMEGPARFQNRTHVVNLDTDWDLGGVTVSLVAAHQFTKLRSLRDQDTANAVPGYAPNQLTITPYIVNSAELRVTSNNSGIWNWSLGAFYTKQTGNVSAGGPANSFFAPAPYSLGLYLPIDTLAIVPVYSRTLSFNATSRLDFGKFTVEGGIRYSDIKNIQTAEIDVSSPGFAGFPPFGIPPIAGFSFTQEGIPADLARTVNHPITGGASISYKPTRDLTFYAAYGHAFRAGSAAVGAPLGISDDLIKSNPERTDSWEVGAKAAVLDRRINLSATAFYQKIDGYLARFPGIYYNCRDFFGSCNNSGPPINNATDQPATNGTFDFNYNGNATVKGIEGAIEGRPTDNWDVSVNASYARSRYKNALLPCNDYNGDGIPDSSGSPRISGAGNVSYCRFNDRLANTPDFSITANTELRFPIGNVVPFVRALVSYRPGFFSDRDNYHYNSFTNLNLYVGVRGSEKHWELNVFAKNLLNQKRIINIGPDASIATSSGLNYESGYRVVNVTNPREIGGTLSYRW